MNDTEFRHFIKVYSGVPTRCFLTLGYTKEAMSQSQLQTWTSGDSEQVKKFINMALLDNYIIAIPNGRHNLYQLTAYARQLPFFIQLPEPDLQLTQSPLLTGDIAPESSARLDPTADSPHSGKSAVLVVDVNDSDSLKDLKILKQHQQQNELTADFPQSALRNDFLDILRAAKVWRNSAGVLAEALASGAIPLTIDDVLAIIAWGRTDANTTNLGGFVRYHIEQGNAPDDKEFRPPIADKTMALKWALASPAERAAMFTAHCPACKFVVLPRCGGRLSKHQNVCPVCRGHLTVTSPETVAGWPVYDEPTPEAQPLAADIQPDPNLFSSSRLYWELLLGEMRVQLNGDLFQAYIGSLVLISHDLSSNRFTVAGTPEVIAFVRLRFLQTMERALSAILRAPVMVHLVPLYPEAAA